MADDDDDIPVLTDALERTPPQDPAGMSANELAALEKTLVSTSLRHAEDILRDACREAEHVLLERAMQDLRTQLPDIVRRAIREHFDR